MIRLELTPRQVGLIIGLVAASFNHTDPDDDLVVELEKLVPDGATDHLAVVDRAEVVAGINAILARFCLPPVTDLRLDTEAF
jgi:hypothetical protein